MVRDSEWILAGSFFFILGSLFAIAKIQTCHYSSQTEAKPVVLVHVEVTGFVEHPDIYEVPVDTPLGAVLRKASPKRFANLRQLDPKSLITGSMQLVIEPLTSLKISVTGAVSKTEELEVPLGTRVCQLKKRIICTEETDLTFFKKRKLLADGEVVIVPKKNHKEL